MSNLKLSLACSHYDRTRALADGSVRPDGIDLTYLPLSVEEIFFRMLRFAEFDAAEMSLSSYVLSLFASEPPFVAIPVFPSRVFRHSSIYVRSDSDVHEPAQLRGRQVGVPEYQMTAGVWIRGILAEHHELPVESVEYRTGGLENPGRTEKIRLDLRDAIRVRPIAPDQTLTELLLDGEIDALYSARMPAPYSRGDGTLRRLFDDPQALERAYYIRTGIFPIMHTVVIKREVYEDDRWIAQSLTKAFIEAQAQAYGDLYENVALNYMLPWLVDHVQQTRELMGRDFWPYGLPANQNVLRTFIRYSHGQGLVRRELEPADLFVPETLERFSV